MNNLQTTIHPKLHQQFQRHVRWTLSGSILYETLKALHCFALLYFLSPSLYGAMGSIFSLIYFTTYLADMGASNTLPPFFHLFNQNKTTFFRFVITYSIAPNLIFIALAATGTTIFAASKIAFLPALFIIPTIITLETIRTFCRVLLYTTFQAKKTVVTELTSFALYLSSIWIPFLIIKTPLTLNHLFIPHLIDSAITTTIFILLLRRYYKTLPNDPSVNLPTHIIRRIIPTRLFNYLLRISRNMFTSNFLTPLFAIKFGLAKAGLFYFACIIASSIQAIVKSVLGYSGNALLANVKTSSLQIKQQVFYILSQKLVIVVLPVIILIGINTPHIIQLKAFHNTTASTLLQLLLFLFITFSEFFFILYEQFYIIEEAANKLFFFKLFELTILFSMINAPFISSPLSILLGLIAIRLISLTVIASNAFYNWGIFFRIQTNRWYIATWTIIAAGIALLLRLF